MTAALDERGCRVRLDVFDGPLDLLLNLVRERRLDIATVPLALVADQYFAYISAMEALDIELAADYLVIAATLVFLKSKALLPALPVGFEAPEESAEMVEARLRERLLAYSTYRDASDQLRSRLGEAASFYAREGGDPTTELVQRYKIASIKLARAFEAAMRSAKPEKRTIVRERLSLVEQMDVVMRAVRKAPTSFFALCALHDREGIVVTFLAVLELIRRGRIVVEQSAAFADITLAPAPPAASEEMALAG